MIEDKKTSRCYTVSIQDMLEIWIESFHHKDHLLVVWDARKHYQLLVELGLNLSLAKLYDNKILTVQFGSLDSVLKLFDQFPKIAGPFVQVYSFGKLIKDNIEN
tara:strand:+ start:991 stop:1302 length:312 start_codon:yes stop_codon:yes gene_type:complete